MPGQVGSNLEGFFVFDFLLGVYVLITLFLTVTPSRYIYNCHSTTSLPTPKSKSRKSVDQNRRVEGSFNGSDLSIGSTRAVEKQRSPDRTDTINLEVK